MSLRKVAPAASGAPLVMSFPSLPESAQPPCPIVPTGKAGAPLDDFVPMSVVTTPMCTSGSPPSTVFSALMKTGRLAASAA
jgi:hypothetical protein